MRQLSVCLGLTWLQRVGQKTTLERPWTLTACGLQLPPTHCHCSNKKKRIYLLTMWAFKILELLKRFKMYVQQFQSRSLFFQMPQTARKYTALAHSIECRVSLKTNAGFLTKWCRSCDMLTCNLHLKFSVMVEFFGFWQLWWKWREFHMESFVLPLERGKLLNAVTPSVCKFHGNSKLRPDKIMCTSVG